MKWIPAAVLPALVSALLVSSVGGCGTLPQSRHEQPVPAAAKRVSGQALDEPLDVIVPARKNGDRVPKHIEIGGHIQLDWRMRSGD